jgi:alpha-tubulin suppressor-like RCC1 family protein
MYFNKFWKASSLVAALLTPVAVYTIKPKDGEIWVWGSGRNGELGVGQ